MNYFFRTLLVTSIVIVTAYAKDAAFSSNVEENISVEEVEKLAKTLEDYSFIQFYSLNFEALPYSVAAATRYQMSAFNTSNPELRFFTLAKHLITETKSCQKILKELPKNVPKQEVIGNFYSVASIYAGIALNLMSKEKFDINIFDDRILKEYEPIISFFAASNFTDYTTSDCFVDFNETNDRLLDSWCFIFSDTRPSSAGEAKNKNAFEECIRNNGRF